MKFAFPLLGILFVSMTSLLADDEVRLTVQPNLPNWEAHLPGHPNRVYFLQGSTDHKKWDYLDYAISYNGHPVTFELDLDSDYFSVRATFIDDAANFFDVDGDGLSNDFEIAHYPVLDPFDSSDQPQFLGPAPESLEIWIQNQLEIGASPFDDAPFPLSTPLPQIRFDSDEDKIFDDVNRTFVNPTLPITLNLETLIRGTFSSEAGHEPSYQQTWEIAIVPPDVEIGTSRVPSTLLSPQPNTESAASLSQTTGANTEVTFRTHGMYVIRHRVIEKEADFDDRINEEHFVVWLREDFVAPIFWELDNPEQANATTSQFSTEYLNDRLSNASQGVAKPGLNRIFQLPPAPQREVDVTNEEFFSTDTERFIYALRFADTWEGTRINVPLGTYQIEGSLQIEGDGTSIVGEKDADGNPASILAFSGVEALPRENESTALFVGRLIPDDPNSVDPQTKNVLLQNLLLEQSGADEIERMIIIGDNVGDNGEAEIVERVWCDNLDITNYTRSGIFIEHAQGVLLSDCRAFDLIPANPAAAFPGEEVFAGDGFGSGFVIQDGSAEWNDRRDEPTAAAERREGIRANNNWIWNCRADFLRHGVLVQFGPHHNLIERTIVEQYHEDAFDFHGRGEYANELRWSVARNSLANGINTNSVTADLEADGIGIGNTSHGSSGPLNWIHHNDVINSFGGIRVSGEFVQDDDTSQARDGQISTGSHYQLIEENVVDGTRFGFRAEQLAGQFLSVRNNIFRDTDTNSTPDPSPVTQDPEAFRFELFRAIEIDETFATTANSQIISNQLIGWTNGELTGSGFPLRAQEAIFITPPSSGNGIDADLTQNGNIIAGFPILPSDDTWVSAELEERDLTFGDDSLLRLTGREDDRRTVFLRFDLSNFPDGATVVAARLSLFSNDGEGSPNSPNLQNLFLIADDPSSSDDDQTWTEGTLTWNNSMDLRTQGQLGVSWIGMLTEHLEPVLFDINLANQPAQDEIERALGGVITVRIDSVTEEFVNYLSTETGSSNLDCRPTLHIELAP